MRTFISQTNEKLWAPSQWHVSVLQPLQRHHSTLDMGTITSEQFSLKIITSMILFYVSRISFFPSNITSLTSLVLSPTLLYMRWTTKKFPKYIWFLSFYNLAQMALVSPRAKVRLRLKRKGRLHKGQRRSPRWRRGAAWARRASWSWPSSSPSSSSCSSSAVTAGNQSSPGWFGKRDSDQPKTNHLLQLTSVKHRLTSSQQLRNYTSQNI